MNFIKKIKAFTQKKTEFKPLTRFQFYSKIVSLYICAVGLDMSGNRVFNIEVNQALSNMAPVSLYTLEYTYYMAINGLFLGLAFWKLLELAWYGKDALTNSAYIP